MKKIDPFEAFREDKILRGEYQPQYDVWDPVHPPRRVNKPTLVKYEGRVYQVVEQSGDKLRIQPLHGRTLPKVVSTTSCRLKKA